MVCAIGPDKHFFALKILNIFYPSILTFVLGSQKEPSQGDGSFEYPQHMF